MEELEDLSILLIEDDPDDALILTRLLKTCTRHCRLEHVYSMDDARREREQENWDLVLSDLGLPDSLPGETVNELMETFAPVPVIVVTGWADQDASRRARNQGVQDYLVKEKVDGEALHRSISSAMQRGIRLPVGETLVEDSEPTVEWNRPQDQARPVGELQHLTYLASQDLRLPLRSINGHLEKLAETVSQDEAAGGCIRRIEESTAYMQQVVEALNTYAHAEMQEQAFAPVRLQELLADLRRSLQDRLEEKGATLEMGPLPEVSGCRFRLSLLFKQLLVNALTYCGGAPPRIVISSEGDGHGWRFAVRDEGIGIAPASQAKIFEPFQRLHRQEQIPGAGMGLTLCRRIVSQHGGRLWVESEPGQGSTFYFTLEDPEPAVGGRG